MGFSDHIAFAALMTLYSELKEHKKTQHAISHTTQNVDNQSNYEHICYDRDPSNGAVRLTRLAQKLFNAADNASHTTADTNADELVPSMITGIIVEAISSLPVPMFEQIEIYEYACQYCFGKSTFSGEFLFNPDLPELSMKLQELADTTLAMIQEAAHASSNMQLATDFIRALAEYFVYLEAAINTKYPNVIFTDRPSVISVNKMITILKSLQRKMEEEDPSLINSSLSTSDDQLISEVENLLVQARKYVSLEKMHSARECYIKVIAIQPENWEALFYKEYCAVYADTYAVDVSMIPANTNRVVECVQRSVPLIHEQLVTRLDILTGVGDVSSRVVQLAVKYFTATMDAYSNSLQKLDDKNAKNMRVHAIIKMLFTVGDCIQTYFIDDIDICTATACNCWKIGFECYENCNMPAPSGAEYHYREILKYDPAFSCTKPLREPQNEQNNHVVQSNSSSGGCYIATAVYGSYDCPQVWVLRRYRDYTLSKTFAGWLFIKSYYTISPKIVKYFGNIVWIRNFWKMLLDKAITRLINAGYENTPYNDIQW